MRLLKAAKAFPHAKFYNLNTVYNQYFTSTKAVQKYNTRCIIDSNIYLHAIKWNAAKKALLFSSAQIWNSL